ncbi:BEL1-like homeodomain protein 9 [Cannabis sativa]|nr:BEL1-like homeodomain protein 9 [Cannabis sativa]XP_060966989.1 BEL1-like homeodomain protein 9 [Cannabis sativa]
MERISGGDLFSRGSNTDQLSHVPQQSRRDKLRVQQSNQLHHHQQQHFNFDPTFLSSEMISFSKNNNNNQPNSGDQVINNYLEAMVMSGNELALLPNFPNNNNNNQSITTTLLPNNNNLQGLSLSLSSSSNPPPPHHDQTNKILLSSSTSSSSSSAYMGSISNPYRNSGPLGPFTGYATILKSSKFLRPAQQLLDGFCCGSNQDHPIINARTTTTTDNVSVGISGSGSGGSNNYEIISNIGGEHQQQQHKKAKLLYMQEEVSKRYKQYCQQMDMVVSSFESVAGLSSSTPYVSLALEAMSQHFRCLKMAISDQLKHTRRALGEEIILSSSSSPTSNNNSKDNHHQRLKYNNSINMDYHEISFQKHMNNNNNNNNKSSSNSNSGPNKLMMSFQQEQQQQQQPVWRPQRGLPERSVAVLRAWLFDHFLHPYPTDTDKHMLANQTGLTRNQVSNWFINARVRVWKPMVEEIHTLETKGTLTNNTTSNTTTTDHDHHDHHHHHTISNIIKNHNDHDDDHNDEQNSTKVVGHLINKELEYCSGTSYSTSLPYLNRDQISQGSHHHHQEKRSRLDGHDHDDDDQVQTLVGFVPYHRTELQVWSSHNAPQ